MIGVVIMALAIKSFPLFYLAIPVAITSIIGYQFFVIFGGLGLLYKPFLLTSSFLLLAATIITFLTARFVKKSIPPELREFY